MVWTLVLTWNPQFICEQLVSTRIRSSRFRPLDFCYSLIFNKSWKICGFKALHDDFPWLMHTHKLGFGTKNKPDDYCSLRVTLGENIAFSPQLSNYLCFDWDHLQRYRISPTTVIIFSIMIPFERWSSRSGFWHGISLSKNQATPYDYPFRL